MIEWIWILSGLAAGAGIGFLAAVSGRKGIEANVRFLQEELQRVQKREAAMQEDKERLDRKSVV